MHSFITGATFVSALAAGTGIVVLGTGPESATTQHAPPLRLAHSEPEREPTTLSLGEDLTAHTGRSALSNGWYRLEVISGSVDLLETIPVAGRDGMDSSNTTTWFRQDNRGLLHDSRDRTKLRLRRNGDLTLVSSRGRQLWHSNTKDKGVVRLTLHRNGALTLNKLSGKVVWRSHSGQRLMSGGMRLEPGQRLRSAVDTAFPGGKPTTLTMQKDGNLVHRCGPHVTWQTRTHVRGSVLRMSRSGVLRVITPKGRVTWRSKGGGADDDYAWFDSDRMLMLANGIDHIWYLRTNDRRC